jgi:putative DNA primase/helicase
MNDWGDSPKVRPNRISAAELADKLKAKPCGLNKWTAQCPAHDDQTASLSISEGKNGKVLVHCFAGCDYKGIFAAIGLIPSGKYKPRVLTMEDIRLRAAKKFPGGQSFPATLEVWDTPIVATYDYTNEEDHLLFQKVRFEPKAFRCRRREGGRWVQNIQGVPRVLYRLSSVIATEQVFIAEGEKDVETLERLDFTATCNFDGAGKWLSEYSSIFAGKQVVITLDDDDPGGFTPQRLRSLSMKQGRNGSR